LFSVEEGLEALEAGELVAVVHLDGVEGAVLGAITARHADRDVDRKLGGLGDGLAVGAGGADDPDALGRADLGADAAAGAALLASLLVVDEDGEVAEVIGDGQALLGVLDGEVAAADRALDDAAL